LRIDNDVKLDYSDVLLRPKRSTMGSRGEVGLERSYTFRNSGRTYSGVPIMASNMDGVGTTEMAIKLLEYGMFTCLVKSYDVYDVIGTLSKHTWEGESWYAVSTGVSKKDLLKLNQYSYEIDVNKVDLQYICVDVANGYSQNFIDRVSQIRDMFPNTTIIAGNVVTPDITEELILRGADIIKVGIGPGSVCTTRIKTGIGYPQLSAVIECADAAHGLGGHIIADGGCVSPSDVVKAFAAGADFVMLGGMLAGHDEGGGTVEGDKVKFYGMSSKEAQGDEFKDYRASEGRVVEIPYRGPVDPTIHDILGGLRSACTYVGARTLKQLSKCATFVRVNNQFNGVYTSNTVGE
jgi:GMP reductase